MTIRQAATEMGTFRYIAEDAYIGEVLAGGVAWERDVLEVLRYRLPSAGSCNAIDVGAHVGTHTIPYARWLRDRGRVYAFEPQVIMAELLRHNVELNGCGANVEVLPHAVGHADGLDVTLDEVIHDGPNAGLPYGYDDGRAFNYGGVQLGSGGASITMRTLDSFGFDDVGLLKVDAEGAEPLVLWGARGLITRCRPLISFERNHKRLSASLQQRIAISAEILEFRIEEYCFALGYFPPLSLGADQILLRPR
jgi:FkbM family methyltransferase